MRVFPGIWWERCSMWRKWLLEGQPRSGTDICYCKPPFISNPKTFPMVFRSGEHGGWFKSYSSGRSLLLDGCCELQHCPFERAGDQHTDEGPKLRAKLRTTIRGLTSLHSSTVQCHMFLF